jgi:hypothetical protein
MADDFADDDIADVPDDGGFDDRALGNGIPAIASKRDPAIRRKIEDMLERRRLKEELGMDDDELDLL